MKRAHLSVRVHASCIQGRRGGWGPRGHVQGWAPHPGAGLQGQGSHVSGSRALRFGALDGVGPTCTPPRMGPTPPAAPHANLSCRPLSLPFFFCEQAPHLLMNFIQFTLNHCLYPAHLSPDCQILFKLWNMGV